jgi:hypothetical protein
VEKQIEDNDDGEDEDDFELPANADIERGNAAEDADLAALRGIQDENPVVGHQLAGTAVEEEEKKDLAIRLVSRPAAVSDPEFAALDPMEKGTGFGGSEDGGLNGHDRGLRQDAFFLRIRRVKKLLESLPAQGDFRIIRSRRHQGVVDRAAAGRRLNNPKENRADEEEGTNELFHLVKNGTIRRAIPEERSKLCRDVSAYRRDFRGLSGFLLR